MENKLKSVTVWFAVNRNGNVRMFLDNPKKNVEKGIWESNLPYVNSVIYKDITRVVQQAHMSFDSNPEVLEIQIQI